MKLLIFGATGGTGSQIVEQALGAGHEATAVARRSSAITIQHERLAVVQGDVLDPSTFEGAVAGKDAVISALGATSRAPTTVYSEGMANILRAMYASGVRRLICITASGLDPGGQWWQRWIAKPLLWRLFKHGYADMAHMEVNVRESGLDWTIIRPPRLTDEAHTGRYQIAVNQHLSRGWKISRADLADYIVKHLDDPTIHCAVVEIAY